MIQVYQDIPIHVLYSDNPCEIEGIWGPMSSGKTTQLFLLDERDFYGGKKVQVFKPVINDRIGAGRIDTHSGLVIKVIDFGSVDELAEKIESDTEVVAVDEVQFCGPEIIGVAESLVLGGRTFRFTALDTDFRGDAFLFYGSSVPVTKLIEMAGVKYVMQARCTFSYNGRRCKKIATRTQKIQSDGKYALISSETIAIGGVKNVELQAGQENSKPFYRARCRHHHFLPESPEQRDDFASKYGLVTV